MGFPGTNCTGFIKYTRIQKTCLLFTEATKPMGSSFLGMFAQAFATFLNIYFVLLIVRILLSWFPNVDWMNQPFATLSQLTDPYLNLFRSLIPPLGGIDFSPILAFLVLRIFAAGVNEVAATVAYAAF